MRFHGRIAGFGAASGTRLVVGHWARSPFGAVTDVMVENADGHRMLFAPHPALADFVAQTYRFDEVVVAPLDVDREGRTLALRSPRLELSFAVGRRTPLGRLLRLVPRPLAVDPRWLAAIDPVARRLAPGSGTAGSAGGGAREFYGVTDAWRLDAAAARLDGVGLGAMAPVDPPVGFGFASPPRTPSMVAVVTTIRRASSRARRPARSDRRAR
ncbi:hypothetical protein FJ658_06765 [Schumannella sp. 10F1B-5-1]|nr:hypothetical protein FJ658_06765 [Schumannella sp. 10F1B-5-1]